MNHSDVFQEILRDFFGVSGPVDGFSPDILTNAIEEGRAAAEPGLTVSQCPYLPDSQPEAYQAWIAGHQP